MYPGVQVILPWRSVVQVKIIAFIKKTKIINRVGLRKLKAKICTESGKFETVPISADYQEPQRCQHRAVEYCDGEMLRGFMAWSFVQQCSNGRLELMAMHHGALMEVMAKFSGHHPAHQRP